MNKPISDPTTPHLLGQWTFNEGAGDDVVDSSGSRNHATFERYAGGVELRRVQSKRPVIRTPKSARELAIDEMYNKLAVWKKEFEEANGRPPNNAEILVHPEMGPLARRLGAFEV